MLKTVQIDGLEANKAANFRPLFLQFFFSAKTKVGANCIQLL